MEAGPVHVIALCSYAATHANSLQYRWYALSRTRVEAVGLQHFESCAACLRSCSLVAATPLWGSVRDSTAGARFEAGRPLAHALADRDVPRAVVQLQLGPPRPFVATRDEAPLAAHIAIGAARRRDAVGTAWTLALMHAQLQLCGGASAR
eukprot:280583-Pleurochrysis_carterae.AAC.1